MCLQVFEQVVQAGFRSDAGAVALVQLAYTFLQLFTQVREFEFIDPFLVRFHETEGFPDGLSLC